ncbi:receptor-like protein EIX1 [Quercus lobata]|uniref:receptor-like protein EIX1 n=1 Tax=Quercus lobata TaxID=97700 RepID=UPI001246415F|nr:receptor-like protein EIX1 [Quercus lobata]
MTVITFTGGSSLKLLQAIVFFSLLLHLRPALGFISSVGDADSDNIRCLDGERQALLKLKKGFLDAYGNLSSWGSGDENKNCCNWKGVHCSNQTGHVLELRLGFSYLGGMINPSLLELPYLTYLDLSYNDFNHNHIPEFIGSLGNLEYLDLSRAKLSGPIPHQLGNLSHLQYLNLSCNNLTIIENLEWLSHLFSIKDLDLSFTNLHVANDWIEVVSGLPYLTTLNMAWCDLPPMSPSSFPHLKYFTSLESLHLENNQLKGGIPKFFGDICTLRELHLSARNQFTGSLPDFAMFPSLKEINLFSNKLNGTVSKTIGSLHKLEHLDVSSNSLQGVISEAHFSNLSKLRHLLLSDNSLTLEFDFNWAPPFQLDEMYLRSCKLGPTFPNWILTQSNVTTIDISHAEISDTIPAEWFANLPPKLCLNNFTAMAHKGKSSNNLFDGDYLGTDGGYVCMGIYVDSAMVVLKGREYEYGKNLGLLKIINLSSNKLSGKLPSEISSLLELVVLNISKNNLIGEIPQMIGEIPSSMSELQFLSHLDPSYNNLSGKIPSSTQLQGFDATRFIGNWALCGFPITQKCPSEETPSQSEPTDDVMETCLFLVLGQPEGLDLRNNGSEQGKIVEEVSEPGVTALLGGITDAFHISSYVSGSGDYHHYQLCNCMKRFYIQDLASLQLDGFNYVGVDIMILPLLFT